jgi:hypothetical protein
MDDPGGGELSPGETRNHIGGKLTQILATTKGFCGSKEVIENLQSLAQSCQMVTPWFSSISP